MPDLIERDEALRTIAETLKVHPQTDYTAWHHLVAAIRVLPAVDAEHPSGIPLPACRGCHYALQSGNLPPCDTCGVDSVTNWVATEEVRP